MTKKLPKTLTPEQTEGVAAKIVEAFNNQPENVVQVEAVHPQKQYHRQHRRKGTFAIKNMTNQKFIMLNEETKTFVDADIRNATYYRGEKRVLQIMDFLRFHQPELIIEYRLLARNKQNQIVEI